MLQMMYILYKLHGIFCRIKGLYLGILRVIMSVNRHFSFGNLRPERL